MAASTDRTTKVFDEYALQEAIEGHWGKHGAHAEVYRMLLTDRNHQKAVALAALASLRSFDKALADHIEKNIR